MPAVKNGNILIDSRRGMPLSVPSGGWNGDWFRQNTRKYTVKKIKTSSVNAVEPPHPFDFNEHNHKSQKIRS